MATTLNALLKLGFDGSELERGTSKTQQAILEVKKVFNDLEKTIAGKSNLLNNALGVKSDAQIKTQIKEISIAYKQLKDNGVASFNEISRAQAVASKQIRELKTELNGFDFGKIVDNTTLVGVTALTAGLALAVKKAIEVHDAMIEIKKLGDFTPQGLTKLKTEIIDLSKQIPLIVQDLAKIGEGGVQANIDNKDLKEYIETVAKVASAFKILPEAAGDSFGKIGNIFNLTVKAISLVADAINKLADTTAGVKESALLDVLQRSAGAGSAIGLTAQQISALGATLLSFGSTNEVAGSSINSLLGKLSAAENGSKDFQEAMNRLGIDTRKFAEYIAKDGQGALNGFLEKLSQLSKVEQNNLINKLFGTGEDAQAILKLTNNLDQYLVAQSKVAKESEYAGSVNKAFKTSLESFSSQWVIFKNVISATGESIGSLLLPALSKLLEATTNVAVAINKFVEQNPKISATIAAFAGFGVAAVGVSLFAGAVGKLGGLVGGVGLLAGAFGALKLAAIGLMSNPFIAALVGGTALIAGITATLYGIKAIAGEIQKANAAVAAGVAQRAKYDTYRDDDGRLQIKKINYGNNDNRNANLASQAAVREVDNQIAAQKIADAKAAAAAKPFNAAVFGNNTKFTGNKSNAANAKNAVNAEFTQLEAASEKLDDALLDLNEAYKRRSGDIERSSKKLNDLLQNNNTELDEALNSNLITIQNYSTAKRFDLGVELNQNIKALNEEQLKITALIGILEGAKQELLAAQSTANTSEKQKALKDKINNVDVQIDDALEAQKNNIANKEALNRNFLQNQKAVDKTYNDFKAKVEDKPLQIKLEAATNEFNLLDAQNKLKEQLKTDGEKLKEQLALNFGGKGLADSDKAVLAFEEQKVGIYKEQIELLQKQTEEKIKAINAANPNANDAASLIATDSTINGKNNEIAQLKVKGIESQSIMQGLIDKSKELNQLSASFSNGLVNGLNLLAERGTGAKDVFRSLGLTILGTLRDIANEALKMATNKLITNILGSLFDVGNNILFSGKNISSASGLFGSSLSLTGFSSGGLVGDAAGIGHKGEFVLPPWAATQIGLRNLNLMNRGVNPFLEGYTGVGGKYDVAGLLSKGSYVLNAEATKKFNLQNTDITGFGDRLMGLLKKMRGYADGGYVNNNTDNNQNVTQANNNAYQFPQIIINNNASNANVRQDDSDLKKGVLKIIIEDLQNGGQLNNVLYTKV